MLRKRIPALFISAVLVLLLPSCAGLPSAQGSEGTASLTGGGRSRGQPDWVFDPYSKYDQKEYIAVVGSGSSRQNAERNALGNLVAQFGQSFQIDEKVSTSYREAVQSGAAANWSETTSADTNVAMSAGMDSLVGAEFGEAWVAPNGEHHIAALLNKANAARTYIGMVNSNLAMINNLTNIPDAEKNSLDGYARYQFAAVVADITVTYGNLLRQIGAASPAVKKGDDYRLEAAAIAKTIPVGVAVNKAAGVDNAGRIQGAFRRALSNTGFQTGGANSRYVLEVNVTTSPVQYSSNQNKFTRIEVIANLTDSSTGTVLVPYSFDSREGHTSQSEADNRAIIAAERKINADYTPLLNDYLSRLLPQ